MMEDFGLNPDDVHEDNSTPIGKMHALKKYDQFTLFLTYVTPNLE